MYTFGSDENPDSFFSGVHYLPQGPVVLRSVLTLFPKFHFNLLAQVISVLSGFDLLPYFP